MLTSPDQPNGGEELGMPPGMARRRSLFPSLLDAGQDESASQPSNSAPALKDLVASSPSLASVVPPGAAGGITGAAEAAAPSLKDRVMDDPATRQNHALIQNPQTAPPQAAMPMMGSEDDPHMQDLERQYQAAGQPAAPMKLWQKILLGVSAPFGGLTGYVNERDRQQGRQQQKQQSLLSEIEAERRLAEQEQIGTQRMTLQQQMENARFGQQNQLENQRERARQQQQQDLFGQQADTQQKLFQQQQAIEDQREASRERLADKRQQNQQPGSWQLSEDKDGNPILFNTKTAQTRPAPNMQKAGTYQKTMGPAKDALDYANQYIGKDTPKTGPGDEALMEKFFEMAKPSSGFRMTQQQMDMLKNAQGWKNSLEAKARHAWSGTWFSDTQRQQIVDTMNQLGTAKGFTGSGGGRGAQHIAGGPANGLEEGKTGTGSDGQKYVVKGGVWQKQ